MIRSEGTSAERMTDFFEFIWEDTKGFVYLPTKDENRTWKKAMFEWPTHKASIVSYVLQANSAGKDVYYSPALFSSAKPDKEHVMGSHVLWADYDGNAPEDWTGPVVEPSLRIQSSLEGKQHTYWKLDDFQANVHDLEAANRSIAYETNADISGWDANQVLRPIGTSNYKVNKPVIVYDQSGNKYRFDQFHIAPAKELISNGIETENLPTIQEVLGKYNWPADDLELINKDKDESSLRDRSSGMARIAYVCMELGLSNEETYTVLLFVDDKWEKYKFRDDRKRRLVDIISRARQKIPHKLEPVTFAGLLGATEPPVAANPKTVFGFNDLIDYEVTIEFMIEDFMPIGGLGVIASTAGVGKTQMMLRLMAACALGEPFLHWKPTKKHKVVFLSLEMNIAGIQYFLHQMAETYSEEQREILQRNMLIVPVGNSLDFNKSEGQAFIADILEQHRPTGLYIDSLQKSHPAELSKDEPIRKFFNVLQVIRTTYQLYIMLIHHDRKATEGNKKPRDISDIYGSQFITAEPDSVFHLWKAQPESQIIELRELKNRYSAIRPAYTVRRGDNLSFAPFDGQEEDLSGLRDNFSNISDGPKSGLDL